jgi:cell wall-associated NlpC family hydrolase
MQRDGIGEAVAIERIAELHRNDLIFTPGHVMIYAGKGAVVHAYGGDMTVRQDKLAELMLRWGHRFADFAVRRLG